MEDAFLTGSSGQLVGDSSDVDMLIGVTKQIVATATPRKIKSSATFLALQETMKEKIVSDINIYYKGFK